MKYILCLFALAILVESSSPAIAEQQWQRTSYGWLKGSTTVYCRIIVRGSEVAISRYFYGPLYEYTYRRAPDWSSLQDTEDGKLNPTVRAFVAQCGDPYIRGDR